MVVGIHYQVGLSFKVKIDDQVILHVEQWNNAHVSNVEQCTSYYETVWLTASKKFVL